MLNVILVELHLDVLVLLLVDVFLESVMLLLRCFAMNLDITTALYVELIKVMIAFEIAFKNEWRFLWIEYDQEFTNLALKNTILVLWSFRNRWLNYIKMIKRVSFIISHIFKEEN